MIEGNREHRPTADALVGATDCPNLKSGRLASKLNSGKQLARAGSRKPTSKRKKEYQEDHL